MRVRRMTVVLPARLRGVAEHEARRIAEEAAASLGAGAAAGGHVRIEVAGSWRSGPALSGAVSRALAARTGGRG